MKSIFILAATLAFMVFNVNGVIPPPDRPCPPDKPRVNCLVAPCMFATCPAYPQAICVDNYCGGCFADFYYQYRKVDCSV
ncbi:secreted [Paramuricea clavata]|uniref:Secreted, partial n=1 Tax=Paramuricea clavata TaxID=317549 RepID=A0A7D9E330_PARCT|nr:secreted [Paramuricea clavata]